MDPDATLQRQRELIKALRAINDNADAETGQLTTIQRIEAIRAAMELVEMADALDGWLCRGGFLPGDWANREE